MIARAFGRDGVQGRRATSLAGIGTLAVAAAIALAACGSGAAPSGLSVPSALTGPSVPAGPSGLQPPTTNSPSASATYAPGKSPSAAFSIHVVNLDGPILDLYVNDTKVAQVACQSQGGVQPVLLPGPNLPGLPWVVRLVGANGAALWQTTEDGSDGPRLILIDGTNVTEDIWPNTAVDASPSACAI